MLKRENYHIKMCFLFLVWQQCASVKKRNRPTDQPASNPTPLTGVGAKPRCRWRASPDWARSLTQEEALRNCLFFSPLLSQKPFESLTHPVQGHPSPPPHPLSFPGGFHNLFAPHLQRGAAGLHFTSPPEPQMRKVCSIGTKKRRKKSTRTNLREKLKWQEERFAAFDAANLNQCFSISPTSCTESSAVLSTAPNAAADTEGHFEIKFVRPTLPPVTLGPRVRVSVIAFLFHLLSGGL